MMSEITLFKTDNKNPDFIRLVALLDEGLIETDGDLNSFYDQFNKIDHIKHCLVAYVGQLAVGCGAFKHYEDEVLEIKRMFVEKSHRGKGISKLLLTELEKWGASEGYKKAILETGNLQIEALKLYPTMGYRTIDNYGQYAGIENSVCFDKAI